MLVKKKELRLLETPVITRLSQEPSCSPQLLDHETIALFQTIRILSRQTILHITLSDRGRKQKHSSLFHEQPIKNKFFAKVTRICFTATALSFPTKRRFAKLKRRKNPAKRRYDFFFRRFIFALTKRYENEAVPQIEFMTENNHAK